MKKFINPIILVLFLVISLTLKSQNIGFDTSAINLGSLPDTINLNDSYTHYITIQNKSAIQLTGNIRLWAAIDSAGVLISIDSVGSTFVFNFGLNDTVGITYTENYDVFNNYKIGGNIVVVWPVADFSSTADTLLKNVYIKNPVSTPPVLVIDEHFLIYPNPTKDYIYFKNNNPKIVVKQVRISDVNGRIIYSEKYHSKIDISYLSKGIYFLKLETKNKEELHYKFIKE